jgi:hypothetical protein
MPTPALRRLAVLSLAASLAAQAPPLPKPTAEDVLPASTYATVRFGGLAACRAATDAMPLAAAVATFLQNVPAEVRAQHLDEGLQHAAEHLQQHCEQLGLRPADVRAVLGRPMTLALGRLTVEGWGPSVALVVETGDAQEALARVAEWGMQAIVREAGGGTLATAEIGGAKFHTLAPKEGPTVWAGTVGGCYVVTNSRGMLGEMLAVAAGKQPALTTATRLGALRGNLPAPALASAFVNAARVLSAFVPHLPYEAETWADALGLGAIDAVYWALGADAHGGTDLFHVGVGGSERGLLKALVAAPADLSFAEACSANTVVFGAATFDAAAVADACPRVLGLLPASAQKELLREVRREAKRAGTSLDEIDGIAHAFGSQVAFAIALEKGAVPKPELLVRVAVRDAKVVGGLLQQLEAMVTGETGLQWKSRKAGEHDVRFCNLQLPEAEMQLSPSYLLTNDALWFASDTAALVRALRQGRDASLAAQPDFTEVAQAAAGASGVVHCRLFRAAEIGWRTVETLAYPLLDAQKDMLGFGSEALPDSETLAKALGTLTSIYRVDDSGVTTSTRGLLTNGALLAALGLAGDTVLDRASTKVY